MKVWFKFLHESSPMHEKILKCAYVWSFANVDFLTLNDFIKETSEKIFVAIKSYDTISFQLLKWLRVM